MAYVPSIGKLRWPVQIAKRRNAPSRTGGLLDEYEDVITVHADIQTTAPLTFRLGIQTDTPATHSIWIRWLDWIDTNYIVKRVTQRPDGTDRLDFYRIRRMREFEGRKRFLELECEQEKRE